MTVRVAIIDSGVHVGHPHVGAIAGGVAFDEDGRTHDDYVDRLGHGTAVTAAIKEKAPDAELYAVKVFDRTLGTRIGNLIAAIDWAAANGIDVANLSLGTSKTEHEPALGEAVDRAAARGLLIVAARDDDGVRWLPGSLPGVVPVQLDQSCPRNQYRVADVDGVTVFRASGFPREIPGVPPERNLNGISFAVANMTGFVACALAKSTSRSLSALVSMLVDRAAMLVYAVLLGGVLCAAVAAQEHAQFSTNADLVVLHVNVKDKHGTYVAGLTKEAFAVLEDDRPQTIRFFTSEDEPATIGVIVDSSASMYANRGRVMAAATALTEAAHPRDELFAIAFNERVRRALPATTPFTSDVRFFREALSRTIVPSGRTALFEAVSAGLDYLARGHYDRRDLILLSDGGDNASRTTFNDVIAKTQAANAVIYTVALAASAGSPAGNPKLLERLARATGGEAYAPGDIQHITEALTRITRDIRQTYTIGYVSTNTARDGRFRRLRVNVSAPAHQPLAVRTREGYRASRAGSVADDRPAKVTVSTASSVLDVRVEPVATNVYRVVVANRSRRALIAIQYDAYRGRSQVLDGRRKTERNEPIALPGRDYAFEIQPSSAIDRLVITSVLWEDGAVEGDGALAADERVLDIGKAVQLRRVLKLLHEFADRNGEVAWHAFRTNASALPLTGEVPFADASRTGMQQVKDALMKDFDAFERPTGRAAVTFATWVADTTAAYEEWLARIAAR